MREIKYKAVSKSTGAISENIAIDTNSQSVGMWIGDNDYVWFPISDFDIYQYTGLKDKNGREVFEGDVYEFTTSYEATDPFGEITTLEIKGLDTVTFEDGAFYHGPHLLSDVIEYDDSLTYIGNIYEINKLAGENQ